MGVDTKAIIRKGTTIEEIANAIGDKYGEVKIESSMPYFFQIIFNEGKGNRMLSVSFSNSCEKDNGIPGVWLSLGCYGKSVEILRYLCETFGGYLDENDCDDKGFYPINYHLYAKSKNHSKMDEFKHKVIHELGHVNLNKTMALFEEYKKIETD